MESPSSHRGWALRATTILAVAMAALVGCADDPEPDLAGALLTFDNDSQIVGYRGGVLTREQFEDISAAPLVDVPMPVVFATSAEEGLTQRAKNQVRAVIASAVEERGDRVRVEPIWVRRNDDRDVEILAVIDNPTDDELSPVAIEAELVNRLDEPKGDETFRVPTDELGGVPAGMAAFLILTMDQERLSSADVDITQTGVKLELASP